MRTFLCLFIGSLSVLGMTVTTASAQQGRDGTEAIEAQPVIKIDLRSLSPEVLKCNVCRMRLGLKPIPEGGTLDAAEHDAQAQVQAGQLNDSEQSAKKAVEAASVTPAATSANPFSTRPEQSKPKKLEGHNLEGRASLEPGSSGKLEQFNSPSEATKFSTDEQSSVTVLNNSTTKLNSPTAIQIELELAKRQLADRNDAIEGFNKNQIQLESKIAELTVANKQYAASLNAQSVTLENLNTQLRQQTSDGASRLSQVQQELDSTKRELSVAIANQKQSASELAKSTNTQVAELSARLKNAENRAEESKGQADTLRRQRDGFERELQTEKETSKEKVGENPRDLNVMQGLLEKTQRELGETRTAKDLLAKKVSELEQLASSQQKSAQEVESLRVQLEQQAAKFLTSEAAWDAEKAELLSRIPKLPASNEKPTLKTLETPSQAGVPSNKAELSPQPIPAQSGAIDKANEQPSDTSQELKETKDDSASSPFRAGPKTKSRAPRQPKNEGSARREL